jgi:hypothetical protein
MEADQKILDRELKQAAGKMKNRVEILACVSVINPAYSPKLIDTVVTHLVKTLAGEA